jgi:hypothetical protein
LKAGDAAAGARAFLLLAHGAFPPPAGLAVEAEARKAKGRLWLSYAVLGDLAALRLPASPPEPEALWRHFCLEAFVAGDAAGGYCEYNFALPDAWGGYVFSGCRKPVAGQSPAAPLSMRWRRSPQGLRLVAELPCGPLVRLGLSAVLEDAAGKLSYWAIAHPSAKPDFHLADGWAAWEGAP